MKKIFLLFIPVILVVVAVSFFLVQNTFEPEFSSQDAKVTSDFEGAKVKKENLTKGCANQDCIPSIDNPHFETVQEADLWLDESDAVFVLNYKNVMRVYPQRILNWHEIVNDSIGGDPIVMTFCPLSGTPLAFKSVIDKKIVEFGTSGYLYNNNLVMYDRVKGNLWQQISGEAIAGPAARQNIQLERLNVITTTWGAWKQQHPESEVLGKPAGFLRDYGQYPYGAYEEDGAIYFGVTNDDKRLHPKAIIYGIRIGDETKAYSEEFISKLKVVVDKVAGVPLKVVSQEDGSVTITRTDKDKPIDFTRSFWFVWSSFYPDTALYN